MEGRRTPWAWPLVALLPACSSVQRVNPSLPVPASEASAMLRRMRQDPRPLQRPLIVAGGIGDPGFAAPWVARTLGDVAGPQDRVVSVSFFGFGIDTFDGCRDRLIEAVETAVPGDDPGLTVEVDVVGISMGGLVARYAACPRSDGGKRLNIRRLFTISAPHRGARLANLPTLDARKIDMRPGSDFLCMLDEQLAKSDYELLPYTRLGDLIVGSANTAPPGRTPWWVATPPWSFGHIGAAFDRRIMADIAARLRGERPLATEPAAPLNVAEPPREAGLADKKPI